MSIVAMKEVMKEAYNRGWITCFDGNISCYDPSSGRRVITRSTVPKHKLSELDFITIENLTGEVVEGQGATSGEVEMHRMLTSDEASCVLHVHPTWALAAMESEVDFKEMQDYFVELSHHTKISKQAPFMNACSTRLAETTRSLWEGGKYHLIPQKGHGVTVVAKDPWDAFYHVERLEHVCRVAVLSGKKRWPQKGGRGNC